MGIFIVGVMDSVPLCHIPDFLFHLFCVTLSVGPFSDVVLGVFPGIWHIGK